MPDLLVGQPVVLSIDVQQDGAAVDGPIPHMPGFEQRLERSVAIVEAAREASVPVIFVQERHARTWVDFGRELDGRERVHCLEDDPGTALHPRLRPQPDEYHVPKRRYSAFFGTDLEILLRGLGARTLVLLGSLTDVCVHYTFADAHQHDYVVRVAADAVGGSSLPAHEASLLAMEYLQTGAVRLTREIVAALRAHSGPRRPGVRPRLVMGAM
ncbi:MAG: biuret amidohydrolase [Chloroflexota bacterium]|nr:biuret amidohydrolase [Chloroflexota bacterium]